MGKTQIHLLQTRTLGVHGLVFALRPKKTSYSSLELLEKNGFVTYLKPEWERTFVEALVNTHPPYEKNFEHALINPPNNIKPTDILRALHKRSPLIPTLYLVYMQNGIPVQIKQIQDYYELLSLVSDAKEDGLIREE